MSYLYDSKGNRHESRIRICETCGDIRTVQKNQVSNKCVKCAANSRGTCISGDDLFLLQNGRKRRAKKLTCGKCKEASLVRLDHKNVTGLCRNCSPKKCMKDLHEKHPEGTSYKSGIATYRRIGRKKNDGKCFGCPRSDNIHIHHIDCDRTNNKEGNLMPLCPSCHKLIHFRLNAGLAHDEAFFSVKKLKGNLKLGEI